jgi:hypothetical protein
METELEKIQQAGSGGENRWASAYPWRPLASRVRVGKIGWNAADPSNVRVERVERIPKFDASLAARVQHAIWRATQIARCRAPAARSFLPVRAPSTGIADPSAKNFPQTDRSRFHEFLELERRDCDFLGVNRAAQGRPFR